MNNIYENLKQNADISQDDIVSLLELEDFSKVFELADKINFDNFKNKVDIRGGSRLKICLVWVQGRPSGLASTFAPRSVNKNL